MARNSEKQYGRLNRLILYKEKEEYENSHPKRPHLNFLETVEEIQKWLPSIKDDMNFYLKKSQVICYSDEHIEECKQKVIRLEKEYKAFVRKIKQLTPGILDAVPWTNRSYKRKCFDPVEQPSTKKEFVPIATPILDQEPKLQEKIIIPVDSLPLMDQPLNFISVNQRTELSTMTSTSDDTSLEHSIYEKALDNNNKSASLTNKVPNSLVHSSSYQPLTFICDNQRTELSAITSTSIHSDASIKPSVCEKSSHNYLEMPYLTNKPPDTFVKNASLLLMNQELNFNCDRQKYGYSKPNCKQSLPNYIKLPGVSETKEGLVNYDSSSDSDS